MMKDTRLLIRLKEYVNYASTAESNLAQMLCDRRILSPRTPRP